MECGALLGLKRHHNLGDHDDVGDLDDPAVVYECKDDGSRSPAQWWRQAQAARKRAGKPWAVVLAKQRLPMQGEPRGWAQMSIEQWREIRAYIARLETEVRAAVKLVAQPRYSQRVRVRLDNDVVVEGTLLGEVGNGRYNETAQVGAG